jgi:hypothetical protein
MAIGILTIGGIALRILFASVGIGGTVYGLKKMNDIGEANMFNKGICPKCNGHFEYKTEVSGSRAYKCDFCGNAVLISHTNTDKGYKYTPSKLSKK